MNLHRGWGMKKKMTWVWDRFKLHYRCVHFKFSVARLSTQSHQGEGELRVYLLSLCRVPAPIKTGVVTTQLTSMFLSWHVTCQCSQKKSSSLLVEASVFADEDWWSPKFWWNLSPKFGRNRSTGHPGSTRWVIAIAGDSAMATTLIPCARCRPQTAIEKSKPFLYPASV